MKKEIREQKEGIIRITTVSERWYTKGSKDKKTGLPIYKFIPSVTWITSYYPKGIAFWRWLASKGWDEAEALKIEAGKKGTKIHLAVGSYLMGNKIKMDDKFINPETGTEEELSLAEYEGVMAFDDFYRKNKPETIAIEMTVFNEKYNYAGTLDWICRLNGKIYLVDFKTGQYIWPSHKIQISAYKHADLPFADLKIEAEDWSKNVKLAILRLGYKRNRWGWKLDEIEDQFGLFLSASNIWANETKGETPLQKDYPLSVQIPKVEKKTKKKK